ncbi:MAG: 3-hydroxyacyl-CoA dehydrogenase NAD-binding domain-containing protein [bacterium]
MKTVNILGFGVMGRQVAALLQSIGYDVTVWSRHIDDDKSQLFCRDIKRIDKYFPNKAKGKGHICYVNNIELLMPALTFEVLVEDVDVKRRVIESLVYDVGDQGILTNTSSYSPSEIHCCAVGLHFFNPIYLLRFAELSCTTFEPVLSIRCLVESLCSELNVEIVHVRGNRGYIGNYLLFQDVANAFKLLEKYRYDTKTIDKVLNHMGRSISLFDIVDLVGVDVTRQIIRNLSKEDPSIFYPPVLDRAIARGVLGKKNRTSIRDFVDEERVGKGGI